MINLLNIIPEKLT